MNIHLCTCNALILVRLVHSHSHKCNGANNCFGYLVFGFGFLIFSFQFQSGILTLFYMFVFACLNLHVILIISALIKNTGSIPEVLPAAVSCLLTASSVIFGSTSLSMLVPSGVAA